MTTKQLEQVSAAYVRAWARSRGMLVGARGRLSPEVIAAFNKAHRVKMFVSTTATTKALV